MATAMEVNKRLGAAKKAWTAEDELAADKKAVYTAYPRLDDRRTDTAAPPADSVCSYFYAHAAALQREHERAKESNRDAEYTGVKEAFETVETDAPQTGNPPSGIYRVRLVFTTDCPDVKERAQLLLHGGAAARVVERLEVNHGIVSTTSLTLEFSDTGGALDHVTRNDRVLVRTTYNALPLSRELLALHQFAWACETGRPPFHIAPTSLRADLPPRPDNFCAQDIDSDAYQEYEALNVLQRSVVDKVVLQHAPVTILHGPPGTGKSRTLVALLHVYLAAAAAAGKQKKVLVVGPSNESVGNLFEKYTEAAQRTSSRRYVVVYVAKSRYADVEDGSAMHQSCVHVLAGWRAVAQSKTSTKAPRKEMKNRQKEHEAREKKVLQEATVVLG